ncbi:hypothetical protein C6496_22460 [Candidatus Poribacteria bacterium]|nr:MAG: hypothetical protein C6496_22460 [Candidatus Poribacteria bacterium]
MVLAVLPSRPCVSTFPKDGIFFSLEAGDFCCRIRFYLIIILANAPVGNTLFRLYSYSPNVLNADKASNYQMLADVFNPGPGKVSDPLIITPAKRFTMKKIKCLIIKRRLR